MKKIIIKVNKELTLQDIQNLDNFLLDNETSYYRQKDLLYLMSLDTSNYSFVLDFGEILKVVDEESGEDISINKVTQRQLYSWLRINKGVKESDIINLVKSIITDELQLDLALISIEKATVYDKENDLIKLLAQQLNMSDLELNKAFIESSLL